MITWFCLSMLSDFLGTAKQLVDFKRAERAAALLKERAAEVSLVAALGKAAN
jgi:hypothetical protein